MQIFPIGREAPEEKTNLAGRENCQSIVHGQRSEDLTLHYTTSRKRFSGAFRAGAPSPLACLLLAHPFFLCPLLPKACYAGYLRPGTRIIHRYPLSIISIITKLLLGMRRNSHQTLQGPVVRRPLNIVGVKVYFGFLILLIKSIFSDNFLYSF